MPVLAVSSPAQRPSKVVFPLPEGPTMARDSPAETSKLTESSTVKWLSPDLYVLLKPEAWMMGDVGEVFDIYWKMKGIRFYA